MPHRQSPPHRRCCLWRSCSNSSHRLHRPAWWNRDCCHQRASCSSAESPRWVNLCWLPTWPCHWRAAWIALAFPYRRAADSSSACQYLPSALHAVGDSYLLLTRPAPQLSTIELRFQFRYAASQPPRLLQLDPRTLWFSSTEKPPAAAATRPKVEKADITQALADVGDKVRYNQLRDQIMNATECSKRTAQLAISEACQLGWIVQATGHYHLPL